MVESKSQKIFKGALIISLAVLLSKILGVFRDILLAGLVGLGREKDAYELAFLLPDIINHLVSTGYLSITFIPLFTRFKIENNPEEGWQFFSNVIKLFSMVLIPILVLVWIFIKPLILLLTPYSPGPETLQLAAEYSRIIIPAQLFFFYGAILTAVQHAKLKFFFPALLGLVYNFAIILGGWLGRESGLEGFCWGVLIGAFVGALVLQSIGGRQAGAKFYWGWPRIDHTVKRYLFLTLPLILGLGAVFALEVVFRIYGSAWPDVGVSGLGYAYRIMYTLVAVFGFAVGASSYPVLAELAKQNNFGEMNNLLFQSLSRVLSFVIPSSLVVWFFAQDIISLLLQRGAFSLENSILVGGLLKWYIWCSIALSSQIIVMRCFYAREKMWLPTLINTGIFLITLPLYPVFIKIFDIKAVPILGGIGATLQVTTLLVIWIKISGTESFFKFLVDLIKISGISLLFLLAMSQLSPSTLLFTNREESLLGYSGLLIFWSLIGVFVHLSLQLLLKVDASKQILSQLGKILRK